MSLNVTVTNQSSRCFARFPPYWNGSWDGCPVRDLAEDTFEVLEDGVRQDIILFNRGSVPVSVSLLIDTSTGMEGRMIAVQTIPVWAKPIVASSRLGVRH